MINSPTNNPIYHNIHIIRLEHSTHATFGTLLIDGVIIGNTLELPWINNHQNVSCIPAGIYKVLKRIDWKNKSNYGHTYQITPVLDRTGILFHPANHPSELRGCIAVGSSIRKLRNKGRILINSGATFQKLKKFLGYDTTEAYLTIMDLFTLR